MLFDAGKGYLAVWIAGHWTGWNIRWMMAGRNLRGDWPRVSRLARNFAAAKASHRTWRFIPICWQAVVAAVVLWLIVVVFWRYSSLGSIAAAAAMPVLVYILYVPGHAPPVFVSLGTILIAVLVLAKHRSNIERLIAGEEPRLKFRK